MALGDLQEALTELACPAMVIGGLAVIARGAPRLTGDIDATLLGADISVEDCSTDSHDTASSRESKTRLASLRRRGDP